jgi:hypothetical protein
MKIFVVGASGATGRQLIAQQTLIFDLSILFFMFSVRFNALSGIRLRFQP